MKKKLKSKDDLIYDLIFSSNLEYNIDISDYIEDIYKYNSFVKEIKNILKKADVTIIKSSMDINIKTVNWELKVNK